MYERIEASCDVHDTDNHDTIAIPTNHPTYARELVPARRKTVAKTKQPLDAGETFPSYEVALVDGRSVRIPDQLDKEYNVLLIYRGSW